MSFYDINKETKQITRFKTLFRNFDTISMWITKTTPLKEKLHRHKDDTLDFGL